MKNQWKIFLIFILIIHVIYLDGLVAHAVSSSDDEIEQTTDITEDCELELQDIAANGFFVSDDNILYITDSYYNQIYQYDGEEVTLVAGNQNLINGIPNAGYIDGKTEYTLFDSPYMAVAWNGGIIVSDTGNQVLRYIADGIVETYLDQTFVYPTGLAVDDEENLYLADSGAGIIYKINTEGNVEILAENLHGPRGLYWYEDVLYVTDIVSNQIFSIQEGEVEVVAGKEVLEGDEWIGGYLDTTASEALFSLPEGIYVDETGIYVGDVGNQVIRKIVDGVVYTVYSTENITYPTAIIKYNEQLLTGDPFLKVVQEIQEIEIDKVNQAEEWLDETEKIWSLIGVLTVAFVIILVIIGLALINEKSEENVESKK